jgi:molybdenum cofactor biosynthesis enzyme MoaA
MDSVNLEPRYSTNQIPGKCIKCLAEKELYDCLRELLRDEKDDEELKEKYRMMITFLRSPESKKLRDESEKLLAEGKKVTLKISEVNGKPEYELEAE